MKLQAYQKQILKMQGPSSAFLKHAFLKGPGKSYYAMKLLIGNAKLGKNVGLVTLVSPKAVAKQLRSWGFYCRAYRGNIVGAGWRFAVITAGKESVAKTTLRA